MTDGVPGQEDFTPKAVYRSVLTETVQHPLTILPAATSAVAGLYMVAFEPALGAMAVAFGGAVVAAGSWIWNYFVRGEELAARHVEELREKRRHLRHAEVESLEAEWMALGHADGAQQARELREAYDRFDTLLRQRFAKDGGLNTQRMMVLAEDTYHEGGAVLRQALELQRALAQVDRLKLTRELEAWRAELASLPPAALPLGDQDPRRAAAAEALETRIAANTRRLDLGADQERRVAQLLAQSEELEAALEASYLEAIDLGGADLLEQGAAERLEGAVRAARRVEERLRGTDEAATRQRAEDDVYLAAGGSE